MKSVLKEIEVRSIILDKNNPRLKFSKIERDVKQWNQKELEEIIKESQSFNRLKESIKEYGVMDPVWVHDMGDQKYEVVEGNMRITVLRDLMTGKTIPPNGITYNKVMAHIIPRETSKDQLEIQKAVLQTGKNPWGAFNEAAHIFDLFSIHGIQVSEIANMLGKSLAYIRNEIENFQFYKEFIEFEKKKGVTIDPKKYSFFKDAQPIIRQKFFRSKPDRVEYFGLITPNQDGITKIPSVSLKGGLRTFAKFAEDTKILEQFKKDPRMTVDDAYFEFMEKNSLSKQPWVGKIPMVINGMKKLTKSERDKILDNPQISGELKKLAHELAKFLE